MWGEFVFETLLTAQVHPPPPLHYTVVMFCNELISTVAIVFDLRMISIILCFWKPFPFKAQPLFPHSFNFSFHPLDHL